MNPDYLQTWGEYTVLLRLPGALISLTGLSTTQRNLLRDSYAGFIAAEPHQEAEYPVECRAYRLEHAPSVPLQELVQDNQYAVMKVLKSDRIELTGNNFEAQIHLNPSSAEASLGVLHEHEFAQVDVFDNFLRVITAHRALEQGGVILHSAGLVFNGQAYIFVGRSNAGKTTLTRKAHQSGLTVLSDDINLVLPGQKGYEAFAVPFTGEFGRFFDQERVFDSYPVAGMVLLEQSEHLETRLVRASEAVARLLIGCPFVNTDEQKSTVLFDALTDVVARVPIIALRNRRDDGIERIMGAVECGLNKCLTA